MGYTTVYLISTTGEIREIAEYRNSHRFTPFIWSVLCKRYLGGEMAWLTKSEALWAFADDNKVPREWRAALFCTFDWAVIERSRFAEIAVLLKCFMYSPYIVKGSIVDGIASLIEQHALDVDVQGMCFYPTLTATNLWFDYDGLIDESVPYDFKTGTKHFYVGEALDKVDGKPLTD